MKRENLTKKEELFCKHLERHCSPREAAGFAGYLMPNSSAQKLMADKRILKRLRKANNTNLPTKSEIADGLRRIAFGSTSDAIRLILNDNFEDINLDLLDLINVQEIKRPKGGGMEIKFFDRTKALEILNGISQSETECGDNSFFKAILASVKKEEDAKN